MRDACVVDGCEKRQGQGGMCFMHYNRKRQHGTTDDPRRMWQERFWSHVRKSDGCWVWTSATDHRGYGLLGGRAPMRAAHRLSYLLAYGDPAGRHVCHHCDNPPCVRPDHLFLGDDESNLRDMAAKKRSTWGERHRAAKLTERDVLEIRRLISEGVLHRDIAARFGVSRVTVSDIKSRKSWYHLD